jgi:5'(3')-deoxyribonucleotidase
MDGTLVNYNERLYEEIQNSKKIPQEIKNILFDTKNRKHIDLSLSIDYKQTNITREELTNMLNNIRQTKTFFKSLSFRPEVITTLKELNEIFDIHFVSKPSEKVESQSEYIKAKLISDSL